MGKSIIITIITTYTVKGVRLLDEDLNNILDIFTPALDARHNDINLSDTSNLRLLVQIANNLKGKMDNHYNNYKANLDSNMNEANYANKNQLPALYKYLVSSLSDQGGKRKKTEQDTYDLKLPSNRNSEDRLNLEDYSKIYLVLDPKANIKHKDIIEISDLLSSVFKSDSKDRRYKGFVVRDNSRRRRNSKESYSKRDSMEHDYKPKRARKEHQGGGRTAIPYIRQRGDIYEKRSEFD